MSNIDYPNSAWNLHQGIGLMGRGQSLLEFMNWLMPNTHQNYYKRLSDNEGIEWLERHSYFFPTAV